MRKIRPSPTKQAQEAWQVHRALLVMEAMEPELRDNPRWQIIRMDAYEQFHGLYTRCSGAN